MFWILYFMDFSISLCMLFGEYYIVLNIKFYLFSITFRFIYFITVGLYYLINSYQVILFQQKSQFVPYIK